MKENLNRIADDFENYADHVRGLTGNEDVAQTWEHAASELRNEAASLPDPEPAPAGAPTVYVNEPNLTVWLRIGNQEFQIVANADSIEYAEWYADTLRNALGKLAGNAPAGVLERLASEFDLTAAVTEEETETAVAMRAAFRTAAARVREFARQAPKAETVLKADAEQEFEAGKVWGETKTAKELRERLREWIGEWEFDAEEYDQEERVVFHNAAKDFREKFLLNDES